MIVIKVSSELLLLFEFQKLKIQVLNKIWHWYVRTWENCTSFSTICSCGKYTYNLLKSYQYLHRRFSKKTSHKWSTPSTIILGRTGKSLVVRTRTTGKPTTLIRTCWDRTSKESRNLGRVGSSLEVETPSGLQGSLTPYSSLFIF